MAVMRCHPDVQAQGLALTGIGTGDQVPKAGNYLVIPGLSGR